MEKKAIVYGAGVSGTGAKKLLEKLGYEVVLVDDKTGIKKEEIIDKVAEYVRDKYK
jgi:UDP-N-acetylmuramoylalanine--D-glutamate ligase